ncbi:hypothetical protein [Simkania negevensis]|uniref:Uncharacterized protein n=1 Tax=Simkania negevensis (strain ATCC VR-1471 / DSM 27360 / Z) TaxID=331113 RepID=F8L6W6_SIMNZ|nr:hypothetical protein [Simkania negevensis]CCB88471.1 unknown protein [Simkania negevensis Z]
MDIADYTAFFHDGSLRDIWSKENNIFLILESAEINPHEIKEPEILSKSNRLTGCLCLIHVKLIKENDHILKETLKKRYQDGEILEFEIKNKRILLLIEWRDPSIDFFTQEVSEIQIEAEKVYWENK